MRHGLQLGVRLVAGLEYGLTRQQRSSLKQASPPPPPPQLSSLPQRLLYWSRLVARECGDGGDWIVPAWHAGPEAAEHDLTYLLRCPVFDPEVRDSLTPLSHPEADLSEQIQSALRRRRGSEVEDLFDSVPPRPDQVDSEAWMWMTDDENLEQEFLRRSGGGTAAAAAVLRSEQARSLPTATTTRRQHHWTKC